jgi:hypothetical protein
MVAYTESLKVWNLREQAEARFGHVDWPGGAHHMVSSPIFHMSTYALLSRETSLMIVNTHQRSSEYCL